MKEATSELNLTVIVVTLVALLSLFFFSIIWPSIPYNFNENTQCDVAICPKQGTTPQNGEAICTYRDSSGVEHDITCAWKG